MQNEIIESREISLICFIVHIQGGAPSPCMYIFIPGIINMRKKCEPPVDGRLENIKLVCYVILWKPFAVSY